MAKYSDETRQQHLKAVKQIMAMKPRASLYVIQESLKNSKLGYKLNVNYILKIRNKIVEDRQKRFSEAKIERRISELQEKAELVQDALFPILVSPTTPVKEKIKAAKTIMDIETDLFNSQMDAGMFERKLGELGIKHDIQLDPEDKKSIVDAFINMGLMKAKPVDAKIVDTNIKVNQIEKT